MMRLSPSHAAALLLAVAAFPAAAAPTPANGVLTTANSETNPVTYTSGPNTGLGQAGADNAAACNTTTNPCDEFALMVQLPADYAATRPNDLIVLRIEWTNTQNDYDLVVLDEAGNEIGSSLGFLNTIEEVRIPAGSGTRNLRIRANWASVVNESYTGYAFVQPEATGGGGGESPGAGVRGDYDAPRFHLYHSPQGRGVRAGEPTLFSSFQSLNTMYIAVLETLRVVWDDSSSPARATWSLHSPANGTLQSLDPILVGDEQTGRVLSSQLIGANSLLSYTDDEGETWVPAQVGPPNGGADHQSIAIGPYGPDTLPGFPTPLYPNAVYYCSQSVAAAFCARSDDGAQTFGPGIPLYDVTQCTGLHGHVKVAPDGTVYVPNKNCLAEPGITLTTNGHPGVAVSTDSGVTWTVRVVPDGVGSAGVDDPSVAIATDGSVYLGFLDGNSGRVMASVSRDRGATWQHTQDIGAQAGIEHIAFPAAVAGDPDRAAIFFLGTTDLGNYADAAFEGTWYPYVSYTEDGGQTWVTNKVSEDIVQRNGVCGGGACRNLLDFTDAVIDKNGFLQFGYADGCVGSCELGAPNSFQSQAVIARQSGGPSLLSANDPAEPVTPKTPLLSGYRTQNFVQLEWPATDNGGSPIIGYRVYRSVNGSVPEIIGSVTQGTAYTDLGATVASSSYTYQVAGVNQRGEGTRSAALSLAVGDNVPADARVCTLPGITALTDPTNADEADGPITTVTTDVTEVLAAEPVDTGNLALTLRMPGFTAIEELTQYTIRFGVESGVHENGNLYFVRADNGDPEAGLRFIYGYMDPIGALTELGELPEEPEVVDGEIRFQIPKSLIGNPPTGTPISQIFATVSLINPTTGLPAGVPGAASPYLRDRAGFGRYVTVGNDFCPKGAVLQPPVDVPPPVINPPAAPVSRPVDKGRFGSGAAGLFLLLPFAAAALRRRRV